MKIIWLFVTAVLFGSCARANYPVKRLEGKILFVNQSLTGMRILSNGKIVTIELGSASSVRTYEMRLSTRELQIGDEVSMFEKGKSRVVFDRAVTGLVKSQNPLTFSAEVFSKSGVVELREGVFPIGDYASLQVEKWQRPKVVMPVGMSFYYALMAADNASDMCICFAAEPTHIKIYTILDPQRVEFTRFRRRELSDLAVNQYVSIYVGILPNHRLRTRGIAIVQ